MGKKKQRRLQEINLVLRSVLQRYYLKEFADQVSELAEQEVVKRVVGGPIEDHIQKVVERAVMDTIGRLVASRIKIDVSLLKLEGQHDDH